jgi:hypothetical protein
LVFPLQLIDDLFSYRIMTLPDASDRDGLFLEDTNGELAM